MQYLCQPAGQQIVLEVLPGQSDALGARRKVGAPGEQFHHAVCQTTRVVRIDRAVKIDEHVIGQYPGRLADAAGEDEASSRQV